MKVQAAQKAANTQVIWQEWLEDCVQRQGSLPEDPYLVIETPFGPVNEFTWVQNL
ncbi:hypothetical protein PSTG_15126 [Puccinia striiformis f. sp. tritici PST-78]|uniref:BRCT domain-containing protein n=1 Tax=Puccinia striiformis f. sp. tritici PST-78 TaxID=1165861 RepID=A0A0L0UWR2_9BASI|nr:hypothetical protein PSTG_15126 [Puccinia striiformis f. sp. tritici PST-78]